MSGSLLPFILPASQASAAQLTSRSLTMTSGVPSKSGVQYTFGFTIGAASTSTIKSLKFQACTVAVGTCGTVAGLNFATAAWVSQSGFGTNATAFAADATGAGDCIASATILCAKRASGSAETGGSAHTIVFNTITNPSATNTAFYVRITTYSGATSQYNSADIIDTGTVAGATVQSLTINANIAEVLNFCVGNFAVTATQNEGSLATPTDCTGVSGNSLSLGNLDAQHVNVSPVPSGSGGDGEEGIAMLRTNAATGATVSYDAIQSAFGTGNVGTLRINSASTTCSGTSNTDPCINALGTTHLTETVGTEAFGMTISAVNCTSTTSYTCSFAAGNYNLIRNANYNGDGTNTTTNWLTNDQGAVTGSTHDSYAWDQGPAIDQIASSSTFVDDEALILKFAAAPAPTTPYGAYSVSTDFIATPTF